MKIELETGTEILLNSLSWKFIVPGHYRLSCTAINVDEKEAMELSVTTTDMPLIDALNDGEELEGDAVAIYGTSEFVDETAYNTILTDANMEKIEDNLDYQDYHLSNCDN